MTHLDEPDLGPLNWVKKEIEQALGRASLALAQASPSEEGRASFQFAQNHLHQARGALSIVGLEGLATFADSLDQLFGSLARNEIPINPEIVTLCTRALAAIANYQEEVAHGAPDQALRLARLYAEIGRARGQPNSPVDLFYPKLDARIPRTESGAGPREKPGEDLSEDQRKEALRTQRSRFERGLLLWLRETENPQGASEMCAAVTEVAALDPSPQQRTLWACATAFLEALAGGKLRVSPEIKRLTTRIDALLRKLPQIVPPPERLLRELLFQIAVTPATTARQQQLRASFGLDRLVPPPGSQISDQPLGPVLKNLRDQLVTLREHWSRFNEGQASALQDYSSQLEKITQAARTLSRPAADRLLTGLTVFTAWLRKDPLRNNERIAMEVATSLLLAETVLSAGGGGADAASQVADTLSRLDALMRGMTPSASTSSPSLDAARRQQEREALDQLQREILSNLSHIEQILDSFFRHPERRQELPATETPLAQIEGAFQILGEERACAEVHRAREEIAEFGRSEAAPEAAHCERLAHRLSALGMYVESLRNGPARLEDFLNPGASSAPTQPTATAESSAATPQEPGAQEHSVDLADPETETSSPSTAGAQTHEAPALAAPTAAAQTAENAAIDAELLEIFIEEAREVLGNIAQGLQRSEVSAHDAESLTLIRRGFHTLKGSGRMVGLSALGEAAWGLEQTLNRWLQMEWTPTPALHQLIGSAQNFFHGWVEQLAAGSNASPDATRLLAEAERLRSSDAPEEEPLAAPQEAPAVEAEAEAEAELASNATEEAPATTEFEAPTETQTEAQPEPQSTPEFEPEPEPEPSPSTEAAAEAEATAEAESAPAPDPAALPGLGSGAASELDEFAAFDALTLSPDGEIMPVSPTAQTKPSKPPPPIATPAAPALAEISASDAPPASAPAKVGASAIEEFVLEEDEEDAAERDIIEIDLVEPTPSQAAAEPLTSAFDATDPAIEESFDEFIDLEGAAALDEQAQEEIPLDLPEVEEELTLAEIERREAAAQIPAESLPAEPVMAESSAEVDSPDQPTRPADPTEPVEAQAHHELLADSPADVGPEVVTEVAPEVVPDVVTEAGPEVVTERAAEPAAELPSDLLPADLQAPAAPSDETELPAVPSRHAASPGAGGFHFDFDFDLELDENADAKPGDSAQTAALTEPATDYPEFIALEDEEFSTSDAAADPETAETSEVAHTTAPATEASTAATAEVATPESTTKDAAEVSAAPTAPIAAEEPDGIQVGDLSIPNPLFDLYIGEAAQHAHTLRRELSALQRNPTARPSDEAIRAAHTLAGISGTARIESVRELAKALEFALERLHDHSEVPDPETLDVVLRTCEMLEAMVAQVATQTMPLPVPELLTQLDALSRPDRQQPARSTEGFASTTPPDVLDSEWDSEHHSAQFARDDSSEADAESGSQRSHDAGPEISPIAEPHADHETADQLPPAPVVHDDIDPQLLPIFLEEGNEQLTQLGETLRAWRQAPDAPAHTATVARLLHTLKGSARMAGAMTLGEQLHALESALEAGQRQGAETAELIDQLEHGLDLTGKMLEKLAAGEALSATDEAGDSASAASEAPSSTDQSAAAPSSGIDSSGAGASLRVRAELIDRFVNQAGEIGIARTRIDGELRTVRRSLLDLTENVIRLRNQLREIELQAELQMHARTAPLENSPTDSGPADFDPLEMDRYTRLQELTRMMAESVSDVTTVQQNLLKNLDGAESALNAQGRLSRELQQALMGVRMVPFDSLADRLYRIVRQSAKECGKRANLEIEGGRIEIDRSVLERMTAPLEHLLRNAIAHGIEAPAQRQQSGKTEIGEIRLKIAQEGNEIAVELSDDGGGLDFERIARRAREAGMIASDEEIDERRLSNLIFVPGFTTASTISTLSGRGVGMDVVKAETAAVGGRIDVSSQPGKGTSFRIYLPLTLAVTQALLVRSGPHTYAIPSTMVAQVMELKADGVRELIERGEAHWQDTAYAYRQLRGLLGEAGEPELQRYNWVLLLRAGAQTLALHVDSLRGNQEIVVKNAGPQLARVIGISGATVLGDGEIVLILNPVALASRSLSENLSGNAEASANANQAAPDATPAPAEILPPLIMVVDDSLTVRKITGRLLEREGYRVLTAKDGVDAIEKLLDTVPDAILSDIEMPRMDGFDFLRNVRADARLRSTPVVMITSRQAEKHRRHAEELGANHYLGKPYQEEELLAWLTQVCGPKVADSAADSAAEPDLLS